MRFVDEDQEGREEWVPPARLKVLWEHAEAFMVRDRLWEAARRLSLHVRDTNEDRAVGEVIDHVYPDTTVTAAVRRAETGLLYVEDLEQLLDHLGWTRAWFVDQPAVFLDPLRGHG